MSQEGEQGHQAVTAEERERELESSEAYKDRVASDAEAKEQDELISKIKEMNTLERLMRQEATDSFNLVFQDEAGDYAIPVRYLTTAERKGVIVMISNLGVAGAEASGEDDSLKLITEAFDTIVEMSANLVTDPVFAQGIRDGKLSDKTCLAIITAGLKRTVALEETGASFRLN